MEDFMINFVACVRVGEQFSNVKEKLDLPMIFKEFEWPVLPREGEMFQLGDDLATPVDQIFHWRHADGTPNITLYFVVYAHDYEEYLQSGRETSATARVKGKHFVG
jgi:hypothetical protein